MKDVIVIGGGPAGLAAAVTLASEGRSVLLLEATQQLGGQAGTTTAIENYLSHVNISGANFAAQSCAQCLKFGVEIKYGVRAKYIHRHDDYFIVNTQAESYTGRVIVLAIGLASKRLDIPGDNLPGVHYGMDVCALPDAYNTNVVIIGGGNSAGQAAVHYADLGARVNIVARRPLRDTMSSYLVDRLVSRAEFYQFESVESITRNPATGWLMVRMVGGFKLFMVDCVHIFPGQEPMTDWLDDLVDVDLLGYIHTNIEHQTSFPGIFAVGDVEFGSVKRALVAAGRGVEVVPFVHDYLDHLELTNYRMPVVRPIVP